MNVGDLQIASDEVVARRPEKGTAAASLARSVSPLSPAAP